jgi:5-methylcytosine-specific restriction endonuclease McrA
LAKHHNESDRWYGLLRWKKRRKAQLLRHPLCASCLEKFLVTPASVCDHVEPHHGDRHKFEFGALQSLCAPCHDSLKRVVEQRGYSTAIGLDGWPTDKRHPAWSSDRRRS